MRWPRTATLKDLRHLFATSMVNAGVEEPYRRFLMGHAPAAGAITNYTHLNRLREQYAKLVRGEWGPLLSVLHRRLAPATRAAA